MQLFQKLADNALTICFSVFGIWVIWLSYQLGVPDGTELGYNLAFYPRLLGWFILAASLMILLYDFLRRDERADKGSQMIQILKDKAFLKRLAGSILLVTIYLSLISIVGYLILTPIFLFSFIIFLGDREKWIMALMASILLTCSVYFFFWVLLYIPLPEGILIRHFW
jgi:hypothetical protein